MQISWLHGLLHGLLFKQVLQTMESMQIKPNCLREHSFLIRNKTVFVIVSYNSEN